MIPGKAHQNAEAERNGSREEIITGLRISKRPRSLVECLRALFMPEDCFRLPTKSDEVFFFYHAYIFANKIGQLFRVRTETTYNDGVIGKTRPTKVEFYFDMRS